MIIAKVGYLGINLLLNSATMVDFRADMYRNKYIDGWEKKEFAYADLNTFLIKLKFIFE